VTHTNRIELSERDVRSGFRIEVSVSELSPAERAEVRRQAHERRALGVGGNGDALLALQGVGLPDQGKSVVEAFLGEGATSATLKVVDENSSTGRLTIVLDQTCAPGAACRFTLAPPRVEEDAPTGSKLVRLARLAAVVAGRTRHFERELDQAPTHLRRWSVSGPFPYDSEKDISTQRYAPEKTDSVRVDSSWKQAPVQSDQSVDLRAMLGDRPGIAYGVTCFNSTVDQGLKLRLNSDDGVEVFLDGVKILSKNVFRALDSDPDEILTLLKRGDHQLLFKVANRAGGWGFKSEIETGVPVQDASCVRDFQQNF
jgi:hypothetical protein